MDKDQTILALAALAQPTRLDAFRTLVAAEPHGVAAGQLADELGVPQNTLSSHLAVLARAGLAQNERQGRSIRYRADLATLNAMMIFLLKDCCGGSPDVCAPLIANLDRPETV